MHEPKTNHFYLSLISSSEIEGVSQHTSFTLFTAMAPHGSRFVWTPEWLHY